MGSRDVFTRSEQYAWRLNARRTHYLDTSVLRRRSRQLPRSPLRHVGYTSALALVELIADARKSEPEFTKRGAAVEAVFKAELPVDWQFPEAKIACAFPRLRQKYDIFEARCGSLQTLIALLRSCKSAREFSRRAEALSLPESIRYFEEYDASYGRDSEGDLNWPQQSRKLFHDGDVPVQFLGLSSTVSYATFIRAFQSSAYIGPMMLSALAEAIAETAGTASEPVVANLCKTYDHSIEPFMKALSCRHFERALGRQPERNDAVDLAHFLYLVPDATLVTADRSLAELAAKIEVPCSGPDTVVAGA